MYRKLTASVVGCQSTKSLNFRANALLMYRIAFAGVRFGKRPGHPLGVESNHGGGSERIFFMHLTTGIPPSTRRCGSSFVRELPAFEQRAGVCKHDAIPIGALSVSEALLARANVIFEGNGGSTVGVDEGFEGGEWTFTDGLNTRRVSFDETIGASPRPGSDPSVIATGTISSSAYSSFFGMCSPDLDSPKISYILFDLHSTGPIIDTARPEFSVTIADRTGSGGSPDVDAVGVFVACRPK